MKGEHPMDPLMKIYAEGIRKDERKKVLNELNLWRLKRMNGTLKKDVWKAWNEETELIEKLKLSV